MSMKEEIKMVGSVFVSKRFKSFYWHTAMMVLAACVSFLVANLTAFNLPTWATMGLGLVLGQVSKELNNRYGR